MVTQQSADTVLTSASVLRLHLRRGKWTTTTNNDVSGSNGGRNGVVRRKVHLRRGKWT